MLIPDSTVDYTLSTLTQRVLLGPAQVVAGQQKAQRESPPGGPPNATVTAPQALQGADVQTAVLHHCYRQNAASCACTSACLSSESRCWGDVECSSVT